MAMDLGKLIGCPRDSGPEPDQNSQLPRSSSTWAQKKSNFGVPDTNA